MKKIKKYEIISGDDYYFVNSRVRDFIEEGYQPYGPLTTCPKHYKKYSKTVYTQTMVLYEEDTKGMGKI